jgi:hypothetical protein
MGMKVRHRVSESCTASGDGQTKFSVPSGTDTVEKIVVGSSKLNPGSDYKIEGGHSLGSPPETFTLRTTPKAGDSIRVVGIIWERKS